MVESAHCLVGSYHDRRKSGDDRNSLEHFALNRLVLRRGIIAVQRKHCLSHLIHDIRGRISDDNVLAEVHGKVAVLSDEARERSELALVREHTEQEEIRDLLVAVAPGRQHVVHDIANVVSAVDELALDGLLVALAYNVAMYAAYVCDARNNAGTVGITQTALYSELSGQAGIDSRSA